MVKKERGIKTSLLIFFGGAADEPRGDKSGRAAPTPEAEGREAARRKKGALKGGQKNFAKNI